MQRNDEIRRISYNPTLKAVFDGFLLKTENIVGGAV